MSLIAEKCVEFEDNRNECIASENGKTFKLINSSSFNVKKVAVDKCLPQDNSEKRCDFLMSIDNCNLKKVFFIELKGGRLVDGVKQIHSTILYLRNEFCQFQIEARIVGSRDVPDIKVNPFYRKLRKLVESTNGNIKRATNKYLEETI